MRLLTPDCQLAGAVQVPPSPALAGGVGGVPLDSLPLSVVA
jgi:hypothetical protein